MNEMDRVLATMELVCQPCSQERFSVNKRAVKKSEEKLSRAGTQIRSTEDKNLKQSDQGGPR